MEEAKPPTQQISTNNDEQEQNDTKKNAKPDLY